MREAIEKAEKVVVGGLKAVEDATGAFIVDFEPFS